MKLKLIGHDYKYAAEQIMLMLFPGEHPEYGGDADGSLSAEISVKYSRVYATAHTRLFSDGKVYDGFSRVKTCTLTDQIETNRHISRIIKLSFYKAGIAATGRQPVWGALTGVRPGKFATKILASGGSPSQASKYMQKEFFVSAERAELCCDTALESLKVKNSLNPRDVCLYVGIPFCPTRCAYCSFVSNSIEKSAGLIQPFLQALHHEITETGKIVRDCGLNINSVYIGGGTPTTLSARQLSELMEHISSSFDLSGIYEYTVEAGRPDTITQSKLEALKNGGATRISINPQTMSDEVLRAIGRRHSAGDVADAYNLARAAGFGAINMDLIAGLPCDTPESFRHTLDTVAAMAPENITVHTLSLKKGSFVTEQKTAVPDASQVGEMLDYAAFKLRSENFSPYYLYRQKYMSGGFENIGWTKPGFSSLYNICIMEELCSIIALGGGGSTKLVNPSDGKIERIFNAKYPVEYIQRIDDYISRKERIKEFYSEYAFQTAGGQP